MDPRTGEGQSAQIQRRDLTQSLICKMGSRQHPPHEVLVRITEDNHKINLGSGVGFTTRQWCSSGPWSVSLRISSVQIFFIFYFLVVVVVGFFACSLSLFGCIKIGMNDILKLGLLLWLKKRTMNVNVCELLGSLSITNWLVLFRMKESGGGGYSG